jgi:hypothetical protein
MATSTADRAESPNEEPDRRRGGRVRGWWAGAWDELRYRPFLVLLGVAFGLRVATLLLYSPGIMESFDTPRFARVGPTGLFSDYWMPAGYPAFLKILHHVSDHVWFSTAVQHLLALLLGVLVFLTARRLTAPPWLATAAAGVLLLSGDVLYLEHILMADVFMLGWAVAAIAATARGLVPEVDRRWLAVAGACAAAAFLSRSNGIVVVAVLAVCVVVWAGHAWRRRMLATGSLLGGAGVVFLAYVLCFWAAGGTYLGITDMSGWNLYARAAPFADCTKFDPPTGTEKLCESTPPDARPGVFYYSWDAGSPGRKLYQPQVPQTGAELGRFGRAAILHQPGDYAVAVLTDLVRYVEPSAGSQRGYSGQPRDLVSFGFRDKPTEQSVTAALSKRYEGTAINSPGRKTLTVYQNLVRVDRLWILLSLLTVLAATFWARDALRLGAVMFGGIALGLYILPVLTISYDFRYGIPPGVLLAIGGLLGATGLVRRARQHGGEAASAASR